MSSQTVAAPSSTHMRFHGCVLTEHREPTPQESDQSRIQTAAQAMAAERVAKTTAAMQKAETERWRAFEASWNKTVRQLQAQIQDQLIDMSIAIADRILQTQLPNTDMLRKVLEETLAPISNLQGLRVRMSPDDLTAVQHDQADMSNSHYIEWVADPALGLGDIITESRNGIFDGRIKERLAVLAEALRDPERYAS